MTLSAPATFSGNISGVTTINGVTVLTARFDRGVPVVIKTSNADQIAALSTQKDYCVFMDPKFINGNLTLKVAFLGATYTASVPVTSLTIGYQITFNKV